jgi:hypothetical protein
MSAGEEKTNHSSADIPSTTSYENVQMPSESLENNIDRKIEMPIKITYFTTTKLPVELISEMPPE